MVVLPPTGRGTRGASPPPAERGLGASRAWGWRHWLALGLCFGLGHGITERLLKLRSDDGPAGVQNFSVQPFPGQSLEALRRQHGGPVLPLRADLEAIEQDKRMAREKEEAEERRAELEAEQRADREQRQNQADAPSTSLDALDRRDPLPSSQAPPAPDLPPSPPLQPAATAPQLPAMPEAPPAPSPAGTP
jgi:hypothetical protein